MFSKRKERELQQDTKVVSHSRLSSEPIEGDCGLCESPESPS